MKWDSVEKEEKTVVCMDVGVVSYDLQMKLDGLVQYCACKLVKILFFFFSFLFFQFIHLLQSNKQSQTPSRSFSFSLRLLPSDLTRPLPLQPSELGKIWDGFFFFLNLNLNLNLNLKLTLPHQDPNLKIVLKQALLLWGVLQSLHNSSMLWGCLMGPQQSQRLVENNN